MYKLIAFISVLMRQFVLPNPFDPLGETFNVTIKSFTIPLTPAVANWIAEPFMHLITFIVTRIYYKPNFQDSSVGSLLYLVFYIIHIAILLLMSAAKFSLWAVILLIALYIGGHIAINVYMYSDRSF